MAALVGGRYEILRELGRGGMGEVLLARQDNLGRLVVIKRVPPDHPIKHVQALLSEARMAARLQHPCIVSVLDVSADGEPAYVAMEYVAGVTLREMLERAPEGLPVAIALYVAIDVLRGLAYAHGVRSGTSVGVVHRDVKPRNIMVSFAGDTKLIDFGISRWLADAGSWEATSISGTRGYMAPEQQAGVRVDGRADQYAVGITLREMLTGTSPNDGEATAELSGPARAPRATPLDDAELAAIVDRACGRAPDLRYPDCADLAAALEAYATAHGLTASPTQVERWMRDHLGERIARWEREAERASERGLRPATPPTMTAVRPPPDYVDRTAVTVASGEQVPATRRASLRRRAARSPLVAAVAIGALVATGGAIAWLAHARGGASAIAGDPARVAVVAANAGSAGDAWLAPAVEHLGARALRDADARRFALVTASEPGARRIELAYRIAAGGVHVEARAGSADPPLAVADAPSVAEAIARVAPPLATALSVELPPLQPDADEAAEMTRLGARGFDEYRQFRALYERARLAGWLDSSAIATGYEAIVRDDPAWARPYGELHWLYGTVTARSAKVLADARVHADAARDPSGVAILDALALIVTDHPDQAVAKIEPVFRRDDADMLAGETYYAALDHLDRSSEANAVFQRLMDHYPSLYFTGDLVTSLEAEGRLDDAEHLARTAFDANPDNLTAARELVRLTAQRGDLTAAQELAHRMQLVHGDDPIASAELFDALVVSDDMLGAQRVADRMLMGSPLVRARGHYRVAVIAVMQGRFAAAYDQLQAALPAFEPFGREAETPQCLALLRALAPLVGDADAGTRYAEQLASWFDGREPDTSSGGALVRYQLALAARVPSAACPVLADGKLSEPERASARLEARRFGALAGCGACKDVVAAGMQPSEGDPMSLIAFGRCAQSENELALAARAFDAATRLWSSWENHQASPFHAVLAHFYLAATEAASGDAAGARTHYARFLHSWGRADRPLPEIRDAERALAALPAAP